MKEADRIAPNLGFIRGSVYKAMAGIGPQLPAGRVAPAAPVEDDDAFGKRA